MKTPKKYWIKERDNYQSTYFVAMGQLSNAAAKHHENPLHGINIMHGFTTAEEYGDRLKELHSKGETVQ